MLSVLSDLLGLHERAFELGVAQMLLRAVIVFVVAVAMVRLGSRRFMSRSTAFDLILAIMLGSVLSRAITGQAPFFPTIAACAGLVAMHSLFAFLASRVHTFGFLVKGRETLLVQNGREISGALQRCLIGHNDLLEALRQHGAAPNLAAIDHAYLERDGRISIILKR